MVSTSRTPDGHRMRDTGQRADLCGRSAQSPGHARGRLHQTLHLMTAVGMETDFASVPRVFVWFLPQYGRYTKAAVLHDYLWRDAVPAGQLTLAEADGISRRAMWELGVPFLRHWMMWGAVRIGALIKPGGRQGRQRDGTGSSWPGTPAGRRDLHSPSFRGTV
jgi:hypothetical protein